MSRKITKTEILERLCLKHNNRYTYEIGNNSDTQLPEKTNFLYISKKREPLMIITREIAIKINESNFQYYENLGYDITIGEDLNIPVELLSKGSHFKIICECDFCRIQKQVVYKNYVKYDNTWGEYSCRKCSEVKRKESLQKKWGVDYPIQNKKLMKKMKNTLLKKWGVDNIAKLQTGDLHAK